MNRFFSWLLKDLRAEESKDLIDSLGFISSSLSCFGALNVLVVVDPQYIFANYLFFFVFQ